MAGKGTRAALGRVQRVTEDRERGRGEDPITLELRRLQALRRGNDVEVDEVLRALGPGAAAAIGAGYLVSFSKARDGRAVLLRIFVGDDRLDWYCADADFAADLSEELEKAFQPG